MESVLHTVGLMLIPLIWIAVITGVVGIVRSMRAVPPDAASVRSFRQPKKSGAYGARCPAARGMTSRFRLA